MKMRGHGRTTRKSSAFTFVEVLAALLFLGVLIPVVMEGFTISNRAAVMSERTTTAVQLAENQLNDLLLADAWTTAATSGDFGEDHPGYRWEMTRATWEVDSMTELTLTVFFQVQGREHDVQLSTLVNSAGTQL